VNAALRAHQEEWLSLEIRVCPPTLLCQVQQALPCLPAAILLLSRHQAIDVDPIESSRGLLNCFSSSNIERVFVITEEPDPWGHIINPCCGSLLTDVEEASCQTAELIAIYLSRQPSLFPKLYFTWRAPEETSPVPKHVLPSPGELAPVSPRDFVVDPSHFMLRPPVQSSIAPVDEKWPIDWYGV